MKEFTGTILGIIHVLIVLFNLFGVILICCLCKNYHKKIKFLNIYILLNILIMIQWILLDGECTLTLIEQYCKSKPSKGPHSAVNQHPEIYWIGGFVLILIAVIVRHIIIKQNTGYKSLIWN